MGAQPPITRKIRASSFSSRVKKSSSRAAAAAREVDFFTRELKLLARIFRVMGQRPQYPTDCEVVFGQPEHITNGDAVVRAHHFSRLRTYAFPARCLREMLRKSNKSFTFYFYFLKIVYTSEPKFTWGGRLLRFKIYMGWMVTPV